MTREYYRLVPKTETVHRANAGHRLELVGRLTRAESGRAGKTRFDAKRPHRACAPATTACPLKNGDAVTSGEQIEVVLKIHSEEHL